MHIIPVYLKLHNRHLDSDAETVQSNSSSYKALIGAHRYFHNRGAWVAGRRRMSCKVAMARVHVEQIEMCIKVRLCSDGLSAWMA